MLATIHDHPTHARVIAERAFLAKLDGSCRTPIAGLAELDGDQMHFRGPDPAARRLAGVPHARTGPASEAAAMGKDAAQELLERAGPEFMAQIV